MEVGAYTRGMKLAKAVTADEPRNDTVKKGAWIYAAVLVVMALGQLYAFERFIPLIQAYDLPGGEPVATLVAAVIVVSEIFALPFLLRMPLSPLMRFVSMSLCILVPVLWLLLSFAAIAIGDLENAGILGAKVEVGAVLQTALVLLLAALAAWSVWGLYPRKKI